jgi:IclR family mhp operon transcriptional activator
MSTDGVVQSIVRGFSVVEILNQQPVTSLETLHKATGLPKSTLVRLLDTLVEAGYAFQVSRRDGYSVTEKVLRLSAGLRLRDALVDVARPRMEAFTREHKWQISLATCERGGMLIRASTRNISPFSREKNFLNRHVGMFSSALGLAYFASCSRKERDAMLKVIRASDTPDALVAHNAALVAAMVAKVKRNRCATVKRPPDNPTQSFAVPIFASRRKGEVLGALNIFWYRSVMSQREALRLYLDKMYALAEHIAADLEAMREADGGDGKRAHAQAG